MNLDIGYVLQIHIQELIFFMGHMGVYVFMFLSQNLRAS